MYFKKILSRSYQEIELSPMVKIKGLPGKHCTQECVEGLTGTNAQHSTQISSGGDLSPHSGTKKRRALGRKPLERRGCSMEALVSGIQL